MKIFLIVMSFMLSTSFWGCTGIEIDHKIEDNEKRVKDFLDRYSRSEVPGIQYVVVNANELIFQFSGGLADIDDKKPMTAQITMHGYSITKTFTAVAILQLLERGKLKLDDKLITYLPKVPYGNEITIRQLINHTSGIPNPIPLRWVHLASKHKEFNEQATLDRILKDNSDILFEPGEKYSYSNIGYWLLGKIIESITQQTYSEYVQINIIKPMGLNLNDIDFFIHDFSNHAKGYLAKYSFINLLKGFVTENEVWGDYEKNWLNVKHHYLNGPAFGGLLGSSYSFSKFLQDQLKEDSVLLNKQTKKQFYIQEKNKHGELIEMTLGWHVSKLQGNRFFFKEGGGAGYHSEMRLYPAKGIGSIVMVNKTLFNSKKFLNQVDLEFLKNRKANNRIE